jgi:hypothetical protein
MRFKEKRGIIRFIPRPSLLSGAIKWTTLPLFRTIIKKEFSPIIIQQVITSLNKKNCFIQKVRLPTIPPFKILKANS